MDCFHPIIKTFEDRYVCCLRCGRRLRDIKQEMEAKRLAMDEMMYKYLMQDATAVNWVGGGTITATTTATIIEE